MPASPMGMAYSKRPSDRNRCFGRSQPISVRGREIERPASQFLSDINRAFFASPPAAAILTTDKQARGASAPRAREKQGSLRSKICRRCPRSKWSTLCSAARTSGCSSAAPATRSSRCSRSTARTPTTRCALVAEQAVRRHREAAERLRRGAAGLSHLARRAPRKQLGGRHGSRLLGSCLLGRLLFGRRCSRSGPSVFDLSVSRGPAAPKCAGGGRKWKMENKGGRGGPSLHGGPRRGKNPD